MTFAEALFALNEGKHLRNKSWNSKYVFLFKTFGREIPLEQFLTFKNGNSNAILTAIKYGWHNKGNNVVIADHIDAITHDGIVECGYTFTKEDFESKTWTILE
jgi:hypothetical protein